MQRISDGALHEPTGSQTQEECAMTDIGSELREARATMQSAVWACERGDHREARRQLNTFLARPALQECEAWTGHGDGEGNSVACGTPTDHAYATDQGTAWLCAEHAPPINEKGQVT